MSDTLRVNNLFTTAIAYSTLTGSTINTNSLSLSTLTVSSINSGAPGVAAYSTLNVSTLNARSTITASTITTTSYVGIGTSNPIAPLHVYNTQGISLANTTTVNYTQSTILGFNYGGGTGNGTRDSFRILSQAVNRDNGAGPNYDYGAQADLIFQRKTNNLYSGGANDITYTEVMRLGGATGYVGIGTANPGYPLDISGNTTILARFQQSTDYARMVLDGPSGGDIIYKVAGVSKWGIACNSNKLQFLLNDVASTVPMTIDTTGNVGIGSTGPGQLLDIVNNASATMGIRLQSQYSAGYLSMGAVLGINSYIGLQSGVSTTSALTTPTLCVTNGNTVGIGTSNPNAYLAINANATNTVSLSLNSSGPGWGSGMQFINTTATTGRNYGIYAGSDGALHFPDTTAGADRILINSLGYVGIGCSPSYFLDVNGTLNIRGSFTVNGTAVATGTGSVWTVGASNAIYYSAGNTCLYRNRLIFSNAINDFNHSIYNNSYNPDSEGSWDGMKFNVYAGAWFRTGNASGATPTTSMFLNTTGYVGIGTTSVSYPLVVWTTGGGYSSGGNNPYIISPTISVQNTTGYGIVSGWFQKDVIAGGAVGTFSDLRIKNNVQPVTNALETIGRLDMVSHGYIDQVQNRQSCSFGLIAQQVKHIVPDAVLLTTDYIPNIMCAPLTAVVDGDRIMLTFDHPIDLSVNNLVRFILKDRQVEQTVSYVSQDQMVVHVSAWSNPNPTQDQIFVYGKQVDDFHILDKPKMGLLALAGVKELHQMVAPLTDRLTQLESENIDLKQSLNAVLARLNAAGL